MRALPLRAPSLVALALLAVASRAEARKPATQRVDLEAIAQRAKLADVSPDELRAALTKTIKGKPEAVVFSSVLDLGDGALAVAWSECTKAACKGRAATLRAAPGAALKLQKAVALPAPAKLHFIDGVTFEAPAFYDLDGDGSPELLFHYSTTEPPRRALGSMLREHLVAYDPRTLRVVFSHELRKAGGASEESCRWSFEDDLRSLIAIGQCNQRSCLEAADLPVSPDSCKPTKEIVERWVKGPRDKQYRRASH